MSSQGDHHGHLDATAGREVVFCHACSNEWYRDEHGLTCPECHGEITEIIDPENDPRDLEHRSSASTSPEIGPYRYHDDDSDPEEGNIDEHLGPHGFAFRRSVRDGTDQHHHNPAVDPVFERFLDMIQGFAPSRRPGGPGGSFPSSPGERPGDHDPFAPRIHRTTFTSGPFGGGTTSVTIVSGPIHGSRGGPMPGADPFQAYAEPPPSRPQGPNGLRVMAVTMALGANQRARLFSNMMRDIGPPGEVNQGGDEGPGGGPPPGFARSLHDILSLLNPANAMAGDAVYSQEALDRIITGLMEANPQSNAAPPATEEALRNLERKPVNKEMLGTEGKAECTICIDEMKEGDMATFLPCKHWFHEDCVVLWLKEHNTCPICRTPIEKNNRSGNNNNASNNNNNNSGNNSSNRPQGPPSGQSSGRPSPFGSSPGFGGGSGWFSGGSPGWGGSAENAGGPPTRPVRYSRPPSQSQSRLNEALRNISSMQRERERDRDRDRDRGTSSGFSYDTSRMQRRSSHSPTSPRATAPGEHGARMRQRSPSESSRRTEDSDQRRQGHGPISWLRDRFGSGSGNGSSRDGRRQ